MAYPSDMTPRRRKQLVPTMPQMLRRRAASPGGTVAHGGAPVMGTPRRSPQMHQPLPAHQGGQPNLHPGANPIGNPIFGGPSDGRPGVQPITRPPGWETPPGQPNPYPIGAHPVPFPIGAPPPGPAPQPPGQDPNQLRWNQADNRHPMQNLNWWAAQGWHFDPQSNRFHYRPPQPGPGPAPHPGPAPGPGPGPSPGGPPGGTGLPPGLPLDATYEAQRRYLDDILSQSMGAIGPQRDLLNAQLGQNTARLNTNEQVDTRHLMESLAGRGAFGGGIQTRDLGYQGTDYLRQRQDLANQMAQSQGGLDLQASGAQQQYSQGLMEAMLDLANRQAQSQYAVTPQPGSTPPAPGGKPGGGPKKPPPHHWQPHWQPPRKR